jgi:4-carboxymuconolactone decarboxylase
MDDQQRHEAGMRTRRDVLGDQHVDRAVANTTDFTADFQEFITRVAWGDVWQRPGLELRTRSCLTIALLASLGHHEELGMHVKGALRNGVTPAEIAEVLMQVAIYAGVPAANSAFRAAQAALAES